MLTTSKPTWPFILEHTIKFLHGGWTVPTFRTLIKFLSRDAYMSLWQDNSRNDWTARSALRLWVIFLHRPQ